MRQSGMGLVGIVLGVLGLCSGGVAFASNVNQWGKAETQEQASQASVKTFLPGCHQFGHEYIGGRLVFTPVKTEEYDQTIFFIHNIYSDTIQLKYHRTEKTALHPLWQAKVNYNRWAVFATDQQGLIFSCYDDYGSGEGQRIDCGSAIEVCQFPRAKFGEHNKGNYWVTNNQSKKGARNAAIRKGVLLRW